VWVESLDVRDVRNIRHAGLALAPGLNVFVGQNAQGKTSLLEAVALLARGRSFRTENAPEAMRRGADGLVARGQVVAQGGPAQLEVEIGPQRRNFRVDGREVTPRAYQGRLEVVVYSTDRLRVVRGPMRERRQYLDRGAAALWPAYRRLQREYERILSQRNAALAGARRDLPAWTERLVNVGAALRQRRGEYVRRLRACLDGAFSPQGERYTLALAPEPQAGGEAAERGALSGEVALRSREEERAGRSLVGPHRDAVGLGVDGQEAAGCSSGQARSLLLALTLAALELYRHEHGASAVALLDDLDSELDEQRTLGLCQALAGRGQALVTTAHPAWAGRVAELGRRFEVQAGCFKEAS
jgi:DNA replication and repair protein RecF